MLTVSESVSPSVSESISYNHDSLRLIRRMISLEKLLKCIIHEHYIWTQGLRLVPKEGCVQPMVPTKADQVL